MFSDDGKYSRYGLGGNPFRNPSTDSVEFVSRIHANISIDDSLALLKEDVFFKRKSHGVFIVGDEGMGKTHRAMVSHAEALQNNLFSRYISFQRQKRPAMYQFVKAFLPKGSALFSNDKWQRELAKLKKDVKKSSYNPHNVAQNVASALNKNTPSFIIIDNLQDLEMLSDGQSFIQFLFHLISLLQPGVFILVTMDTKFASFLLNQNSQIHKSFNIHYLEPLSDEEAIKIISKWLDSNRLVDDLHHLFPFSPDAVRLLNSQSQGNTRLLLDLADMALTSASFQKAVVITDLNVKESLQTLSEKKPGLLEEKKQLLQPSITSAKSLNLTDQQSNVLTSLSNHHTSNEKNNEKAEKNEDNLITPDSDLIDLNRDQGDIEKDIVGEQDNTEIPSHISESQQIGIKDISSVQPTSPNHEINNLSIDENENLLDNSNETSGFSKMKSDSISPIHSDDNGSKTNVSKAPSIMHQAKQNNNRDEKQKNDESTLVDETQNDSIEESNQINENDKSTWEPIIESTDKEEINDKKKSLEKINKKDVEISNDSNKNNETISVPDTTKNRNEISNDNESNKQDDEIKKKIKDTHPKKDKKPDTIKENVSKQTKEVNLESENEITEKRDVVKVPKQSSEVYRAASQKESTEPSSIRVLHIRCPECFKDFTAEIDKNTKTLVCPFCKFHGEL